MYGIFEKVLVRRTQEGYLPFKDDKPKDAENSPFAASSVLVVKAISLSRQ